MADDNKNEIRERLHTLYKAAKVALEISEKPMAKNETPAPAKIETIAGEPMTKAEKYRQSLRKTDARAEDARKRSEEFWKSRNTPYDTAGFKYEE